ncbi:zinc-binding protein [Aliidiomarina halalkaliphila]|uniref:Zinc-binding protein n=1 Tax=Aliidiomarina halalkaliphila TaxID=2593535 RepID=A0A552X3M8_9GAMM|nr:putative zinc-binding protein [Aliidiomarina halalkaliphila]TRW49650.1 zinc-binding protein [Aliidiomarina halalkaliphila]
MTAKVTQSLEQASKPLIYSCSGCSNVAQLANDIAVRLSRDGVAEMSCIAGVGGNVRPLVRTACSGRDIIALDGCPLACVKHSLKRIGVEPTWHIELTRMGLKKQDQQDCSIQETFQALSYVYEQLGVCEP